MLYLAGLSIVALLSIGLLLKQNKNKDGWILMVWLCFIGMHLLLLYLHITKLVNLHPIIVGFALPLPLAYAPLLFLYVSALTGRLPQRRYLILLHFLPFWGSYFYLAPFLKLPGLRKLYTINHHGAGYENFFMINQILIIASGIAYVAASLWTISKSRPSPPTADLKVTHAALQFLTCGLGLGWIILIAGNRSLIFGYLVIYAVCLAYVDYRYIDRKPSTQPAG